MRKIELVLALLVGCALPLLPACAGDKHMGPRMTESFDKVLAAQARDREPFEAEMGTEEAEQAMTNLRLMSTRPAATQGGGFMPVVPIQR